MGVVWYNLGFMHAFNAAKACLEDAVLSFRGIHLTQVSYLAGLSKLPKIDLCCERGYHSQSVVEQSFKEQHLYLYSQIVHLHLISANTLVSGLPETQSRCNVVNCNFWLFPTSRNSFWSWVIVQVNINLYDKRKNYLGISCNVWTPLWVSTLWLCYSEVSLLGESLHYLKIAWKRFIH